MTKKIIILFLFLAINSPLYASWKFNPFTGKQDFYEDVDSIGDTIYLRQDGTKPLTGNWTVGAYAVSTSGLVSSTGLIVTTSLQDNALTNCNTVDTDGAGIFKCGTDEGGGGSGDITSVGDVTTGAAFDGTQGTTFTFNNAGGDKTLDYDGTDFLFNAPLSVDASDPADSEALRFDNAEGIAWEASPAGTDITLKVDSSEILQASGTFNATTLTEGGTGVPNTGDNLSVFAATTSLQLLGVLSDETGTGALVFGTSPTFTTDITFPAGSIEAGAYGAATIDGDDIAAGLAGRSLTLTAASPDTLDADAETYTTTKCILIETPVDADDLLFFRPDNAITVTSIDCICESATSAVVVINECDSAGDTCGAANSRVEESVTCDVDGATDDGTIGNPGVVAGGWLRAQVGTVTGTPGHVAVCVTMTLDD